jgi:hypothetical protein
MSLLSEIEAKFVLTEQKVASAIAQAWKDLRSVENVIVADLEGIVQWIAQHQQDILGLFQGFLTDAAAIGTVIPQTAPAVAAATTAIDAATAAVNVLAQGFATGATPVSTIANAYQSVKNAQNAVNAVLKQGTSQPATAS